MNQWIQEQEKAYLIHKLKTFGGRIDLTAKSCGVDSRTIHRKMQIYGLDRKVFSKGASVGASWPSASLKGTISNPKSLRRS